MKLVSPYLKNAAQYQELQARSQSRATEVAIACIKKARKEELDGLGEKAARDGFEHEWAVQSVTQASEWVVQTLINGAYTRQFHEWEKATKGYFRNQWEWNGNQQVFALASHKKKQNETYVHTVRNVLLVFGYSMSGRPTFQSLCQIQANTNRAKHRCGGYSATLKQYNDAVEVIIDFWKDLKSHETFVIDVTDGVSKFWADLCLPPNSAAA